MKALRERDLLVGFGVIFTEIYGSIYSTWKVGMTEIMDLNILLIFINLYIICQQLFGIEVLERSYSGSQGFPSNINYYVIIIGL